jgi:5-methylcytosine-specific restriction protein A
MTLANLTQAGVVQALEEFDEIGRDAFLAKYGFRKSKSYFLVHNGQRYDSKAIAGAALAFSGAGNDPLSPQDFSGGEKTVKPALERLGYEVVHEPSRNPDWTRDELILAFDFYMRHRDRMPDKSSEDIARLSSDISKLGRLVHAHAEDTFRNPNGVYMKAMNFRRFDPNFRDSGRSGLSRGGQGDERIWNDFADDPKALAAAATAIRNMLVLVEDDEDVAEGLSQPLDEDFAEAIEGGLVTRLHRTRERNKQIVKRKKEDVIRRHGRLGCEACAFDFEASYGDRGRGFIECHHLRPVRDIVGQGVTRLNDLALLCSNCHRMVHAKSPWLSLDELRALLKAPKSLP